MSGLNSQVGFALEGTYATYAAPSEWVEITSESMKLEIDRIESSGMRAGRRTKHRWASGPKRVSGTISTELTPGDALKVLLEACFGGATLGSGTSMSEFYPGPLNGKSLTVQVGKPDINGTVHPFTYLGCKVDSFDLGAKVGEFCTFNVNLVGANETLAQPLATAVYEDEEPFTFVNAYLMVNDVEVCVTEFSLNGSNTLMTDRHRMCGGLADRAQQSEPVENGLRDYTGSFKADFKDLTLYNLYTSGAAATLALVFEQPGGVTLMVNMSIRVDGETPTVGGPEALEQPVSYVVTNGIDDLTAISVAYTPASNGG